MRVSFKTDGGAGSRASLGLIVLQNDETIEGEFRRMLSGLEGVALHCSRIACAAEISAESLSAMRADLPRAASLLPSGLAAAGYACTSGATILGEAEVARLVRRGCSAARTSNPLSAAKAAFGALGVRRLAFVTPYAPEVSAAMRGEFERTGMEIAGFCSFEERDDRVVARISPESCLEAIVSAARVESCEGVFIACTNLRALGALARAEEILGVPVVSSNQALAWHLLRLAGIDDSLEGFGRLFKCGAFAPPRAGRGLNPRPERSTHAKAGEQWTENGK